MNAKFKVGDKVTDITEDVGTILEVDERKHGLPDYLVEWSSGILTWEEENYLEKI